MTSAEPKRCLGCGYILEGLPENRCPECGRTFDARDPTTYLVKRESGRSYLAIALVAAGAIVLVSIALLLDATGLATPPAAADVLTGVLGIGSAIASLGVVIFGVPALRRPPGALAHRRSLVAALVVAMLVLCLFGNLMCLGRVGGGGHTFGCGGCYHEW